MKSIIRFNKNLHGSKCQNCGYDLSLEDNFCRKCGQVNDTRRLSVKSYFSEYLSGFFEFDNRFLRTVVPLLTKPGIVSKNYVDGRRIYYANPFQLYLHITILFFLLFGLFQTIDSFKPGSQSSPVVLTDVDNEETSQLLDSIREETLTEIGKPEHGLDSVQLKEINQGIEQVTQTVMGVKDKEEQRTSRKQEISQLVDSIFQDSTLLSVFNDRGSSTREKDSVAEFVMDQVSARADSLITPDGEIVISDWTEVSGGWDKYGKKSQLNREGANRMQEILKEAGSDYAVPQRFISPDDLELPENALGNTVRKVRTFMDYDKSHPDANVLQALDDLGVERSYWNVYYYNKAQDWNEALSDSEYWEAFQDRILSRVSVALFFLLPVFTLVVSLLYFRHRYNYTENLVFVFHIQTVFFLLLMIFMIIGRITGLGWTTWVFLSLFLFYLYKAMRAFYGQGRFKTIVKFLMLNFSYLILAIIGGVIVSFIAFFI